MRRSVLVVMAVALGACSTEEPPVNTVRTTVAYEHVPSGMVFPTQVGPFARTNVYPGRAGSDGVIVGYAYMAPSGPTLITVTLEASPPTTVEAAKIDPACRQVFERRKDDIGKSNSAVKWLEDRDTSVTLAGGSKPAMLVDFDYEFRGNPVRGYLIVACHVNGDWTLHYRVTSSRDPQMAQVVAAFMAELPAQPLHKTSATDK